MSNSAKSLDAADLDLLGELVDFWEEIHKPYAPKEEDAWTTLIEARMALRNVDDGRITPTNAGRSLIHRTRQAKAAASTGRATDPQA